MCIMGTHKRIRKLTVSNHSFRYLHLSFAMCIFLCIPFSIKKMCQVRRKSMERMGEFIYFQNFYFKPSFLRYRKFSFVEFELRSTISPSSEDWSSPSFCFEMTENFFFFLFFFSFFFCSQVRIIMIIIIMDKWITRRMKTKKKKDRQFMGTLNILTTPSHCTCKNIPWRFFC